MNAEDGTVADAGGLETIAHSIAMCSWNNGQRCGGQKGGKDRGWQQQKQQLQEQFGHVRKNATT